MVSANEPPSEVSASEAAARLAFFKVQPEEGTTQPGAAPDKTMTPDGDAPSIEPGAGDVTTPGATGDDTELPVYQELGGDGDPSNGDGDDGETTFTPPAWIAALPAESRSEAEKFARGQYEQTQKHKKRSSEAAQKAADAEKAKKELEEQITELKTAPVPVNVPELALADLRTKAEVDAFVEAAPKQLAEKQQWHANCQTALQAIEKDGSVEMFGQRFTEDDVPALRQQAAQAAREYQEINTKMATVPKRYAYLEKFAAVKADVSKVYPDLLKADTPMAKAFHAKLKAAPSLAADPEHQIVIGDHLMMKMVRTGKYRIVAAQPKAPAPKASAAPTSAQDGGTTTVPTPRTGDDAASIEVERLRAAANAGDAAAAEKLRMAYFKVGSSAA